MMGEAVTFDDQPVACDQIHTPHLRDVDLFAHPHPATLQMPPHSRLGARPCAGTDPAQCSPTRRRELAEDLGDFVWAELPPLQRRFEQRGRLPGRQTVRGMDERDRSEEHTSELQSRGHLVCRLLLETKNPNY